MNKKIIVLVLMLAASVVFLPSEGQAAIKGENNVAFSGVAEYAAGKQIRVRIGQSRRRYRRVYPSRVYTRRIYGARSPRYVTQYYYRNGRRYARTVRVY